MEQFESKTDSNLFTKQSNPRLTFIIGVVIGVVIMTISGLGFIIYTLNSGAVTSFEVEPLDTSKNVLEEPRAEITTKGDKITEPASSHIYGKDTEYKVTLVQYVDYECRFCRKFFPQIKELVDDNPESIRLIIKHYPLVQIHPQAKAAALAAECAAEQSALMPYSEQLYLNQTDLSNDVYVSLAEQLGLDAPMFESCLENPTIIERIEQDTEEALALGIQSQPNIIIWHNDNTLELIDGQVPREYLESVLANEL